MAFMGMRGTGDWVSNQMPENWRQMILRLFPNGQTPLTAIMSMMGSESTDSPIFHWWDKLLPTQRATVTGVYTDVLSSAYVSGGVAAATLYVKMSSDDASFFKTSDVVLLRDASDYTVDVVARVSAAPVQNGASSYITVVLLEADDNSTTHDLSDCDVALVIGTMNEEGTTSPTAKAYDPTERYNYTQIFKNSLEITETARVTTLRTGDAYAEAKRDCLELHSIEMEKGFLWGIRTTGTGTGGKPRRTTNGIIRQLTSNVNDYSLNSTYSGQTWLQGGEIWLDTYLEQIFRYGANEKLCLAGSGAILGINRLAKASGQITIQPTTVSYGLKVGQWITPFGVIYLKTHPLFSYEATNRNSMLILEPKNLKYRYLKGRDTKFQPNIQANDADEKKDQYLTEAGLELHFEQTFGYLNGVGSDNAV
jgi:hypothetical protein